MNNFIKSLSVIATPDESIDSVIRRMEDESRVVKNSGIAVILDENEILKGVVTDGDIRRAYINCTPFSNKISKIMTKDPVTILDEVPKEQISSEVVRKVQLDKRYNSEWIQHVLVVNSSGKLINIVNYLDILQNNIGLVNRVAVFGMGYVGITLAVSLANRGHQVTGIDTDKKIVNSLNNGVSHVYEPGLTDMLVANSKRKNISFSDKLNSSANQVYIIAVGTPLNRESKPDISALTNVLDAITKVLKVGQHIMLRSTVPVGVTREIIIPYVEHKTNLIAGRDFFISFSPERTVEGNAMHELKTLPQVVGGYTSQCLIKSSEFWSTLTHSFIRVDSLESAELVKLANNTFRDLSFSFANELALLADNYNINSFDLVNAANEGYTRNKIPLPSPGVGGYCLTKDPILFSCTSDGPRPEAVLGISSRKINETAAMYPVEVVKRYAKSLQVPMSSLSVLIVGVAFKGAPETTDIRGSVAVEILNKLNSSVDKVFGWDAAINPNNLRKLGFSVLKNLESSIDISDIVLILNNHPDNACSEIYTHTNSKKLIFDGWNQIDRKEIEKIPGRVYATMGYMTP